MFTASHRVQEAKTKKTKGANQAAPPQHFARNLIKAANSPCGLPSLFHSIAFQIPDLRAGRE